jgi:hypothetical protein
MAKIKNIIVYDVWVLVWEEDTKIIKMNKFIDNGSIGTTQKVFIGETKQDIEDKIKELGLLTLKEYKKLNK